MSKSKTHQNTSGQKSALIYCRVSSRGQEEEGTSLDSQAARCIEFAESLGYSVGRVDKEVYTGAELWDRPVLSLARTDLKAGKFQAIICYAIDRLSRDVAHLAILTEEFERAGVELHFVTEQLDKSPEGKLLQSVRAYVAEVERQKILERSMRGKRQRISEGKLHRAGIPLFGYKLDREAGKRVIYEPEAVVVAQIFRWYVEEKMGCHQICQRLIDTGIPSPSAGKKKRPDGSEPQWTKTQVWRILREKAYKGLTEAWRYVTKKQRSVKGTLYTNVLRREDCVLMPDGTTPAIVSEEIWEAAQKQLDSNSGAITRNITIPSLLRGRIYCGVCGQKMYVRFNKRNKDKLRYICKSYVAMGAERCGNGLVYGNEVETFSWQKVSAILKDPKTLTRALETAQSEQPNPQYFDDLKNAQTGLQKCERGIERMVRKLAMADEEDEEVFERELGRLMKEKAGYESVIAELNQRIAASEKLVADLTNLRDYCERVSSVIDDFEFDDKRLAFEALDAKVYATPGLYRVDVPVAVKKEIGLEIEPCVEVLQSPLSLITYIPTHGL